MGGIEVEPGSFPVVIRVRGHCFVGNAGEAQEDYLRYWGSKGKFLRIRGN